MALITIEHLRKVYRGSTAPAVDDLCLQIEAGEFITLLGPSGSGKTTTLMLLAGFETPSAGSIRLDGRPIETLPPHQRAGGDDACAAALHDPAAVHGAERHPAAVPARGHTGLLPRFAGRIFTAEDVVHPKPAPDLFLHAARAMGVEPRHTTVVEDTPAGVTAAKAAGMQAIGYAAMTPAARLHAAGADVVVLTRAEVQALLAADRVAGAP